MNGAGEPLAENAADVFGNGFRNTRDTLTRTQERLSSTQIGALYLTRADHPQASFSIATQNANS